MVGNSEVTRENGTHSNDNIAYINLFLMQRLACFFTLLTCLTAQFLSIFNHQKQVSTLFFC